MKFHQKGSAGSFFNIIDSPNGIYLPKNAKLHLQPETLGNAYQNCSYLPQWILYLTYNQKLGEIHIIIVHFWPPKNAELKVQFIC